MIVVKRGASIKKCREDILRALISVDPIYAKHGVNTVVTSGSEVYKHTADRSGHYRGDAVDLRIKNIAKDLRKALAQAIKRKLGSDFVVLWELAGTPSEHIHIHWSPRFKG